MSLTAKDILAANDVKIVEVQVPEWGGFVFVRTMSGYARERLEGLRAAYDGTEADCIRAQLVALTVCDVDGKLLFSPDDCKQLASKNGNVLARVFEAAAKLNAVTAADEEAETKNS